MVKKTLYFIPFLGMAACTDYQANVENTWGNQDAAWIEQEIYQNELNAQKNCIEGRVFYQPAESNLISYVCYENNWVPYCEEGFLQSYNPTGYVYRCQSNIWIPVAPIENSGDVAASSNSNSDNGSINEGSIVNSSNSNPPPTGEVEGSNVLSGGNFKQSCTTEKWNIATHDQGTVRIRLDESNSCELKFTPNESSVGDINLTAEHSVDFHYGYAYQIKVYGTTSYLNALGAVSVKNKDKTFMNYVFDPSSTWESEIVNHCEATQTMTFSITGGFNGTGFSIKQIEIIRRPSNC